MNSNNTTWLFFQGANICLVVIVKRKGNPTDMQLEPEEP